MFSADVTIRNKTGLHARPASMLVAFCQKLDSRLIIINGDEEVDLKSIINILSAGIKQGTTVKLTAEGQNEEQDGREVIAFIESLTE